MSKTIYYISLSFPPEGRGASIIRGYQSLYLLEAGYTIEAITSEPRPRPEKELRAHLLSFKNFKLHAFPSTKGMISQANLILERLNVINDYEYEWIKHVKRDLRIEPSANAVLMAVTGGSIAEFQIGVFL